MASHTVSISPFCSSASNVMSNIPQFGDDYESCASNEIRRDSGKNHISSLMIWWFAKNEWSHPIFSELADWALNETGSVHPSQLSHIRNKKMRMIGLKVLESFAQVNLAVYAYQKDKREGTNRSDSLLSRLGVRTTTAQIEESIRDATVIMNPVTNEPCWQGDFMGIFLGYIKISGVLVGRTEYDPATMNVLASDVGPAFATRFKASQRDIWEIKNIAKSIFGDELRANKLVAVATGLAKYDGNELQRDICEIALIMTEVTRAETTPDEILGSVFTNRQKS